MQEAQETRVRSLGQEDALEKEITTHSSIFVWEIPWAEEPAGLQSMQLQESDTTKQLNNSNKFTYHVLFLQFFLHSERSETLL